MERKILMQMVQFTYNSKFGLKQFDGSYIDNDLQAWTKDVNIHKLCEFDTKKEILDLIKKLQKKYPTRELKAENFGDAGMEVDVLEKVGTELTG